MTKSMFVLVKPNLSLYHLMKTWSFHLKVHSDQGKAKAKYLLPSATKLGQGYVFTGVCDSVNRGGGVPHPPGLRTHPPRTMYPPDYIPPGLHTPLDYIPPQTTYPPNYMPHPSWDYVPTQDYVPPWTTYPPDYVPPRDCVPPRTVYVRAVRILLECILV